MMPSSEKKDQGMIKDQADASITPLQEAFPDSMQSKYKGPSRQRSAGKGEIRLGY